MSERKIYEIARLMSNPENIERDMYEAFDVVTGLFKEKYINRLDNEFRKCYGNCKTNPSKEVRLIRSLKPFISEANHKALDNLAETMVLMETFANINSMAKELNAAEIKAGEMKKEDDRNQDIFSAGTMNDQKIDKAIHNDGIYEIDDTCMIKKETKPVQNAFVMMIMAVMFGGKF